MTSEYDELLARLGKVHGGTAILALLNDTKAAIRALTAQVVERDAVIKVALRVGDDEFPELWDLQETRRLLSQAPRDALAEHDKALLLDTATRLFDNPEYVDTSAAEMIRDYAKQLGTSTNGEPT